MPIDPRARVSKINNIILSGYSCKSVWLQPLGESAERRVLKILMGHTDFSNGTEYPLFIDVSLWNENRWDDILERVNKEGVGLVVSGRLTMHEMEDGTKKFDIYAHDITIIPKEEDEEEEI